MPSTERRFAAQGAARRRSKGAASHDARQVSETINVKACTYSGGLLGSGGLPWAGASLGTGVSNKRQWPGRAKARHESQTELSSTFSLSARSNARTPHF